MTQLTLIAEEPRSPPSGGNNKPSSLKRQGTFRTNMRQNAAEFDEAEAEDGDYDNGLSFTEFCSLTREREMGEFSDEELRQRFLSLDVTGSGRITKADWLRFSLRDALARSVTKIAAVFKLWDADSSGAIDKVRTRTEPPKPTTQTLPLREAAKGPTAAVAATADSCRPDTLCDHLRKIDEAASDLWEEASALVGLGTAQNQREDEEAPAVAPRPSVLQGFVAPHPQEEVRGAGSART